LNGEEFDATMAHRPRLTAAIFLTYLALSSQVSAAQPRAAVERQATEAGQQQVLVLRDDDARETRERLEELMRKLPPSVGRVIRSDPSLMGNEGYLATYPSLAAFIKQHPEIRTNPGFFFESIGTFEFHNPSQPEPASLRVWRDIVQFVMVGGLMLTIAGAFVWIVRTIVDHLRWQRSYKIHTEVHNKLLDRFTANDDLLAYMQTPAGRRFLESAPLAVETPTRPVGAPYSRILWSVQLGVVLAAGALGLLYVSGRVVEEVAQPFFALSVIGLALGAGFIVSAGASIVLSRKLGLFEPPVTIAANTDDAR
jgi:hypothetical protein